MVTLHMQGREMVIFERFMNFRKSGGNHCQLNVIPIPAKAAAGAKSSVQKAAQFHGFDLEPVPGASKVCGASPLHHAQHLPGAYHSYIRWCTQSSSHGPSASHAIANDLNPESWKENCMTIIRWAIDRAGHNAG